MAKLTRKYQKLFGGSAGGTDIGVFGSLAVGSPAYSVDPDVIQSLNAFATGWMAETVGNKCPAIQDFNAVDFLTFYQLCYLLQSGVAEYNNATAYYTGSLVNDGTGVLYKSLSDDNVGNALNSAEHWALATQTSAASFSDTFVNGDLSTGVLTVTHDLNSSIVGVTVIDNNGKIVLPDEVTITGANTVAIDLTSFGTLAGTWSVRVAK